jgi:GNAT superfamily N-acetyltransferase
MLYPPLQDFTGPKRIGGSSESTSSRPANSGAIFDNQQLVGIIAFREGWVDQLYVLPSSQRRGIGTALLRV